MSSNLNWKLMPPEPTPEIIAAAAIAAWPTATLADIALAREAAHIVLMKMDLASGTSADSIAAALATMAPAYRAMWAAVSAAAPQVVAANGAPKLESIDCEEFRKLADAYHCVSIQKNVEPAYDAMCQYVDSEIERQARAALASVPVSSSETPNNCAAPATAQEIRVVANPVEFDGIKTASVQAQEPVDWQKIALYYNDLYSQEKNRAPVQSSTQLTEEQVVCALGCIVIGRDMGHISTENAIIVREFIRAAEGKPMAAPDGRSEHYAEIKATLEGAHKVMESLSAIEQRVGPIGSHARGYTHKITAALRHLEALAAPAAQGDAKDAERYRWLRDKSDPGICAFYLSVGKAFAGVKFNQTTVDKAIDAQIAAPATPQITPTGEAK